MQTYKQYIYGTKSKQNLMKKFLLVTLCGLLVATMSFSQSVQSIQQLYGEQQGREVTDLVCPDGSVYSQTPDGLNGVATTDGVMMFDQVLTDPMSPVASVTWWMLEANVYNPLTVDIIFRSDNAGLPGSIFQAFYSVAVPGINTGQTSFGFPVLEYTYTFPSPIVISAGDWVGIADYPDDLGVFHHYWATSSDGDNSSILYPDMVDLYGTDLAFCLGGAEPVPLSNWALGLGIFLILAATLFRLRRS